MEEAALLSGAVEEEREEVRVSSVVAEVAQQEDGGDLWEGVEQALLVCENWMAKWLF